MTNNLKAILFYEEMTAKELAAKIGVSSNVISTNINDIHKIDVYKALRISRVLGYTVEEIWGDECPKQIIEKWNEHRLSKIERF